MDSGKRFEHDFQDSFKSDEGCRILRLYDTTNGFKGIANICDFIHYYYPYVSFLELKSVAGNSLPFSNITENQWNGLLVRSKLMGVMSAIIIQYREAKEGYLVPISELEKIKNSGKKSINIEEARKVGMNVGLIYKRTRCYIDEELFNLSLVKFCKEYELCQDYHTY